MRDKLKTENYLIICMYRILFSYMLTFYFVAHVLDEMYQLIQLSIFNLLIHFTLNSKPFTTQSELALR